MNNRFRLLTFACCVIVYAGCLPVYSNVARDAQELPEILCPMLSFTRPTSTRAFRFVKEVAEEGNLSYEFATIINFNEVRAQKGLWAALTGQTLDLDRLDEVPGISTTALYQLYPDEVQARFEDACDEDGMIFFQDMVDTREWIAEEVGETSFSFLTRGQVGVLFLASGGDLDTAKVQASAVIGVLNGVEPEGGFGRVNTYRSLKAYGLAEWTIKK